MLEVKELYENGYRQGAPRGGLVDASSIDSEVCAESKCESCGHKGTEYNPFMREEPKSYRAFAVCPECEASFEF